MNVKDGINLANDLMKIHPELNDWTAVTNKCKSSFGRCSYKNKEIQLSSVLLPAMTYTGVKNTIIHEIAHALCKGNGHDKVWKRKCIELGGDGMRCGGSEKYEGGKKGKEIILCKISKYTLTCPDCGVIGYRNRKPKYSISCGNHGGYFDIKYKLNVIMNY